MAAFSTLHALETLLLTQIYPTDMNLCRSDSQTAKLVFAYVESVNQRYQRQQKNLDLRAHSKAEDALELSYRRVLPLIGLSQQTIRKYVAETWQERDIAKKLKIELGSDYILYRLRP